jgi:hypothetical protein
MPCIIDSDAGDMPVFILIDSEMMNPSMDSSKDRRS